jgi:hypothetical protein
MDEGAWTNNMLGHKVEETEQMFHTPHKFSHRICYLHMWIPHTWNDTSQKIVFALPHVHSDISGKTVLCHRIVKMAEGTGRYVTVCKKKQNERGA